MTEQSAPLENTEPEKAGPESNALRSRVSIDRDLRSILCDVLGLDPDEVETFDGDTGLFGHLPELDSMAVAGLLTEMEDRLSIVIEDDDVDGETLETYGGLLAFAEVKVAES